MPLREGELLGDAVWLIVAAAVGEDVADAVCVLLLLWLPVAGKDGDDETDGVDVALGLLVLLGDRLPVPVPDVLRVTVQEPEAVVAWLCVKVLVAEPVLACDGEIVGVRPPETLGDGDTLGV